MVKKSQFLEEKFKRDRKPLHGFKETKKEGMNMKMGVTREDILVDLHGGC